MPEVKLLDEAAICAIATPRGQGGLHVIRVSGKESKAIVSRIFRFPAQSKSMQDIKPNTAHFGFVMDQDTKVDEAVIIFFAAPHSYTCEDTLEISVHGNFRIAQNVVRLLIENGARLAQAGEFTQRAFLNGRIDLAQAEAVNQLIAAQTSRAEQAALRQLEGAMSEAILELKEKLMDVLAEVEAFVDFPEEDIEVYSNQVLFEKLRQIITTIEKLLASYQNGEILREGVETVIVGKPNVGKSSLLNTLLKRDRAIVSDIPGTTRDTLEELLEIDGIPFRIVDTAGLREGKDPIEKLGIARTREHITRGELVVFMVDGTQPISEEDERIHAEICEKRHVLVLNKCDLPSVLNLDQIAVWKEAAAGFAAISAKTKQGIETLEAALVGAVWSGTFDREDIVLTSERQFEALTRTHAALTQAEVALKDRLSLEFPAFDLREALEALGEVVGEVYSDDILGIIFSKFCIGK